MTSDESPRVLICFNDSSLGGTSRSALSSGTAWIEAGFEPVFFSPTPINTARKALLESISELHSDQAALNLAEYKLVHIHHSAWSRSARSAALEMVRMARAQPDPPALLTNNVFGVRDPIFASWPGPRAVGVLGIWSALQYRYAMGKFTGKDWPWILPNPQDTDFFHPPSTQQRVDARAEWNVGVDQRCIVRVGSPNDEKWNESYVSLAAKAGADGHKLILLGCPEKLRSKLSSKQVVFPEMTSDDREIRSLYWAADVFALDAKRGESFGNVILEAMASGVQVIYRSHPLRDNTPWEFQDFENFTYTTSTGAWTEAACRGERSNKNYNAFSDFESISTRYSVKATASMYRNLATQVIGAPNGSIVSTQSPHKIPKFLLKSLISLGNNPLISVLKEMRLANR